MLRDRSILAFVVLLAGACHSGGIDVPDGGEDDMAVVLDGGGDDSGGELDDSGTDDSGTLEPDGGMTPTVDGGVGVLACGAMPCDVTDKICCFEFKMGMTTSTCEAAAMCTMGIARACDGPEDCTSGTMKTCCVRALGATTCETACNMGAAEACHDKSECPKPAQANRVAACCPVSQTLRTCRTEIMGAPMPPGCN